MNRTLLNTDRRCHPAEQGTRLYLCVIEHDMDFIGRLCDPVIVMAAGKVLAQGSADSIAKTGVIEAYLGTGLKNKVTCQRRRGNRPCRKPPPSARPLGAESRRRRQTGGGLRSNPILFR